MSPIDRLDAHRRARDALDSEPDKLLLAAGCALREVFANALERLHYLAGGLGRGMRAPAVLTRARSSAERVRTSTWTTAPGEEITRYPGTSGASATARPGHAAESLRTAVESMANLHH